MVPCLSRLKVPELFKQLCVVPVYRYIKKCRPEQAAFVYTRRSSRQHGTKSPQPQEAEKPRQASNILCSVGVSRKSAVPPVKGKCFFFFVLGRGRPVCFAAQRSMPP